MNLAFEHPLMMLWALAPLIVYYGLPALPVVREVIYAPFLSTYQSITHLHNRLRFPIYWKTLLFLYFIYLFLVVAIAKPFFITKPYRFTAPARNLMIAFDVSRSMNHQDLIAPTQTNRMTLIPRIEGAKSLLKIFVQKRKGDRLGLILFGLKPYLQSPMITDTQTLAEMIDKAHVGVADSKLTAGTAIGDAIIMSIHYLSPFLSESSAILLVTDGIDTYSQIDPLHAAELAKASGIKIYLIALLPSNSQEAKEIDIRNLSNIAKLSGGEFFRASNYREFERIYDHINALEPIDESDFFTQGHQSLAWVFLGFAYLLFACFLMLRYLKR